MNEDIHEEAARWFAAQDADDMDWDGFTAWLEADPRHRQAFDAVALLDDRISTQRDAIGRELAATETPRSVVALGLWRGGGSGRRDRTGGSVAGGDAGRSLADREWRADDRAERRDARDARAAQCAHGACGRPVGLAIGRRRLFRRAAS